MSNITLRKITITLILFLLAIPLITAQEGIGIDQAGLQNFIVKEEIKTRNEVKAHIDKTKDDLKKYVETEGQAFIDSNFKVLDERVHSLANKMLVKASIGIIVAIIFSQLIWFLIKRKIDSFKKKEKVIVGDMKQKTPILPSGMPTPPSPPPVPELPTFKLD